MMKKFFVSIALIIVLPLFSVSAKDFGALLDQSGFFSGNGEEDEFDYSGTLSGWFSSPLWSGAETFISASLKADYSNEEWNIIPELLRTELSFRAGDNGTVAIGRISYADPLGFIANGLFDGARYRLDFEDGSELGIGAYYTGLLYKNNANITMTAADLAEYSAELDYNDFADTYFAPSRALLSADWRHPGLWEMLRLRLALLAQFDLSGNDDFFHSQYLTAKASVPVNQFVFEAGGVIEMAETTDNTLFSFAGELSAAWMLPTMISDRLRFLGRFSNGTVGDGDAVTAFVPINTKPQGYILKGKLSGLSMLQLEYTAFLHETLSLSIADSYFVLSDLGTFQGAPYGKDGHFLGNEIYGFVSWSPLSDIQLKAGGGVFLPSWGNADTKADPFWRIDLNLVLTLY